MNSFYKKSNTWLKCVKRAITKKMGSEVIIYYQNYITIYGFTNYFKNKVRKSLVDTT